MGWKQYELRRVRGLFTQLKPGMTVKIAHKNLSILCIITDCHEFDNLDDVFTSFCFSMITPDCPKKENAIDKYHCYYPNLVPTDKFRLYKLSLLTRE